MTGPGGYRPDDERVVPKRVGPYEQSLRESAQRIREEALRRRRAATRRRALLAAGLVVLLGVGGFGGWRYLTARDTATSSAEGAGGTAGSRAASCDKPQSVRVAAPAAILPVLTALTSTLSKHSDAPCATFALQAMEAYAAAGAVGGPQAPDAWVSDSVEWVSRASAVAGRTLAAGAPFASTGIVVAMPPEAAEKLGTSASWSAVLGGASVRVPDPNRSAVGTAVMAAVAPSVASAALGELSRRSASAGPADLARAAASTPAAPVVVTAPELLAYNQSEASPPLAGVAPAAGTVPVSYSLVTVTDDVKRGGLVASLGTFLESEEARETLSEAGYQAPGKATPRLPTPLHGVILAAAPPAPAVVASVRSTWRATVPPTQALLALDASGSMLERLGGTSRLALVQQAVVAAAAGMGPADRLAILAYSQHIGDDHGDDRPLLAYREVGTPAGLAGVRTAVAGLEGVVGGGSGLYDTVLAACQQARTAHLPGATNRVVVVADGPNEDDYGMTLDQLRQQLAALRASGPAIQLTIVGIGDAPDEATLKAIAAAAGGAYVSAPEAADVTAALSTVLD